MAAALGQTSAILVWRSLRPCCRPPLHLPALTRASGRCLSTLHRPHTGATSTLLRVSSGGQITAVRHIADWDTRRPFKGLTKREALVVILSIGTFLLYFLWLRQPSDIDEYMSLPVWKRVPNIDPERAEMMMEVDKYLGLQVDYKELEKYKEEYYAKELEKMKEESRQAKWHQELLQAAASHRDPKP